MSGICGFLGKGEENTMANMLERMLHRGSGTSVHADEDISLGAISSQLAYSADKSLVLCCDGNNAAELLRLYEEHGESMFEQLRGGFAFVMYDFAKRRLFAARDHFGVRPFYYTVLGGQFVFASELKSLLEFPGFERQLNEAALEQYLTFQYSPLPETFFKGVFKLMPGHCLVFEGGEVAVSQYWDAEFRPNESAEHDAAIDEIEAAAKAAIAHYEAEGVEGTFLSSGVDSSFIAANFKGKKSFTVGFDIDQYNEIEYARALSEQLGLEHCSKIISSDEFWDSLSRIQYHTDEPLADPAAVALYFLCELAKEHVDCVFSGEGPDEFFGGYNIYKEPLDLRALTRLPMPVRRLLGALARRLPPGVRGRNLFIRASQSVEERFVGNAKIFSDEERREILLTHSEAKAQDVTKPFYDQAAHLDDVTKMQTIDIKLWLDGNILLGCDKIPAIHGLEVRTPLADKTLFDIAAKLPTRLRVNKEATKYAFRMAAQRSLKSEVAQKKKLGFPVPIRVWLRDETYAARVRRAFEGDDAQRFFDVPKLTELLNQHLAGKADHSRKIWTVYSFLLWYEIYFEQSLKTP